MDSLKFRLTCYQDSDVDDLMRYRKKELKVKLNKFKQN